MASSNQQQDPNGTLQQPPRYVPPHRSNTLTDTRYSKDQLLDLFKAQQSSQSGLTDGLQSLYVGGWQPDILNGAPSASWGKSEHNRDSQPAPDICWDQDGDIEPLGVTEMDDEERQVGVGTNISITSTCP